MVAPGDPLEEAPLIPTDHYRRFERVGDVTANDRGIEADLGGERLRVDVVRDDVVRLQVSRGGVFAEHPTAAVCVDPLSLPATADVERRPDAVRVRTAALTVTVTLDPFKVDVHRADGSPVVETAVDSDGRSWSYATLNDAFTVRRRCDPADAVYGLGEKTGSLNRRGRDFTLWNNDVLEPATVRHFAAGRDPGDPRADPTSTDYDPYYLSIPLFYHHRQPAGTVAASFVDNAHRAEYDFTGDGEYRMHFEGGDYCEYLFAGPTVAAVLDAYTWLTGRPRLPPLWALGYHQCRWTRYRQQDVEALAERLRDLGISCDALWLDIDYMDGYRVFTWDRVAFPDPAEMVARLQEKGLRVVTIVDPGVKREPGYPIYDEGVALGAFCRTEGGDLYVGEVWPGETVFPDFTAAETRRWWGGLNAGHVRCGVAGIWNDMNEPATGMIEADRMRFGGGREPHGRWHNQYALLMAAATVEGLESADPGRRTFVLSRAGFAGIQRFAANWMGDNCSRWDHLWMSLPMAAGVGLCGQPFVGADVGGFRGRPDGELLLRWVQYGALTPFCRNHTERNFGDQYLWSRGEAVLSAARAAIALRYRLMPYLYSAFVVASETGAPVQRPLVFDYPGDRAAGEIDDQYLLGPDLLVSPVYQPGVTARHVYLPAGSWYHWDSDTCAEGPSFALTPTPLTSIPLHARGGSVIPMWPEAPSSADGYQPTHIELHLFVPREEGRWRSRLDEDDGVSVARLTGAYRRTLFEVERTAGRLRLTAVVNGQGYPESRRRGLVVVVHGARPDRVELDGETVPVEGDRVAFANDGTPFQMSFSLTDSR